MTQAKSEIIIFLEILSELNPGVHFFYDVHTKRMIVDITNPNYKIKYKKPSDLVLPTQYTTNDVYDGTLQIVSPEGNLVGFLTLDECYRDGFLREKYDDYHAFVKGEKEPLHVKIGDAVKGLSLKRKNNNPKYHLASKPFEEIKEEKDDTEKSEFKFDVVSHGDPEKKPANLGRTLGEFKRDIAKREDEVEFTLDPVEPDEQPESKKEDLGFIFKSVSAEEQNDIGPININPIEVKPVVKPEEKKEKIGPINMNPLKIEPKTEKDKPEVKPVSSETKKEKSETKEEETVTKPVKATIVKEVKKDKKKTNKEPEKKDEKKEEKKDEGDKNMSNNDKKKENKDNIFTSVWDNILFFFSPRESVEETPAKDKKKEPTKTEPKNNTPENSGYSYGSDNKNTGKNNKSDSKAKGTKSSAFGTIFDDDDKLIEEAKKKYPKGQSKKDEPKKDKKATKAGSKKTKKNKSKIGEFFSNIKTNILFFFSPRKKVEDKDLDFLKYADPIVPPKDDDPKNDNPKGKGTKKTGPKKDEPNKTETNTERMKRESDTKKKEIDDQLREDIKKLYNQLGGLEKMFVDDANAECLEPGDMEFTQMLKGNVADKFIILYYYHAVGELKKKAAIDKLAADELIIDEFDKAFIDDYKAEGLDPGTEAPASKQTKSTENSKESKDKKEDKDSKNKKCDEEYRMMANERTINLARIKTYLNTTKTDAIALKNVEKQQTIIKDFIIYFLHEKQNVIVGNEPESTKSDKTLIKK